MDLVLSVPDRAKELLFVLLRDLLCHLRSCLPFLCLFVEESLESIDVRFEALGVSGDALSDDTLPCLWVIHLLAELLTKIGDFPCDAFNLRHDFYLERSQLLDFDFGKVSLNCEVHFMLLQLEKDVLDCLSIQHVQIGQSLVDL